MSRILKWLPSLGGGNSSNDKTVSNKQQANSGSAAAATNASDQHQHPSIDQCKRLLAWSRQVSNVADTIASSQQLLRNADTTSGNGAMPPAPSATSSGNFLVGHLNGGLVDAGRPTSGLWRSSALVQAMLGLTDAVFQNEVQRLMTMSRCSKAQQYGGRSPAASGGASSRTTADDSMHFRWDAPTAVECLSDLATSCIELHSSAGGGTATGGETLDAIKLFTLIHYPLSSPQASGDNVSSTGLPSPVPKNNCKFDVIEWETIVTEFAKWKKSEQSPTGEDVEQSHHTSCDVDAIARIACLLFEGLSESQAGGFLRSIACAVALLMRAKSLYTTDSNWTAFEDSSECSEQLALRLVDLYHEHYIQSFCRWAGAAEFDVSASNMSVVVRRIVRGLLPGELDASRPEQDELLVAAQGVLTMRGMTPSLPSVANLAAAFVLTRSKELLRSSGDADRALQLVSDCLLAASSTKQLCAKLTERLWCHHAACLRECASLEASTALTREAYDGAVIEVRSSCGRSFPLLLSTLEYGKAYHEALQAVARRQLAAHGNRAHNNITARWRATAVLLSECRATWERCIVQLIPQHRWKSVNSDGTELTPLDVLPEMGHIEMPRHCTSPQSIRPLLMHWHDYQRLMQLHVWLTEATSEALVMLQMGIHQSSNRQDSSAAGGGDGGHHHGAAAPWIIDEDEGLHLRSASRHLFLETAVWLDGLKHPRWGFAALHGLCSVEWAEMEAGMRRGTLLFNHGGYEDAVPESILSWEKVLQSVWLLEAAAKQLTPLREVTEQHLRLSHTAARLQVNICQGLMNLAEREGGVEKCKKLLTDALNYAYKAKTLTAPYTRATTTSNEQRQEQCRSGSNADEHHRGLHQTYLLASYLVCAILGTLRQHRKACVMTEELKDAIVTFYRLRRGSPGDVSSTAEHRDPIVEALLIDATALHASCLAKSTTDATAPSSARDLCDQADALLSSFVASWFDANKTTTKGRDEPPPPGDCLTPLALTTLLLETKRRLDHGAVIQLCLVRGETFASQRRWEDALIHFSQAFDLSQRSMQPAVEVAVLQHLGRCYRELDQTQMAIGYAKQALDVAKEISRTTGNQVLWYRASAFLANLLCDLDRRSEASELWEGILTLAQKYGDHEVECSTAKNMITLLMRGHQCYEAITAAESLEKTCLANKEGSSSGKDRLFALETIATAYIAVGEIKKSLEVIDRMELLEDTDVAAHDTANQLRSQALLAQREDHAAIDVIVEWKLRAKTQKNQGELLKATFALAEALVNVSLADAKAEYSAVLDLCSEMHAQLNGPDDLLSQDQRDLGMKAARWLIHAFHLNDDVLEVQDVADDELLTDDLPTVGSTTSAHNNYVDVHEDSDSEQEVAVAKVEETSERHAQEQLQSHNEDDRDDDADLVGALGRTAGSYGAADFEFDHDEDPEAACVGQGEEDDARHNAVEAPPSSHHRRMFSHDDMTQQIIDESGNGKTIVEYDEVGGRDDADDRIVALVRCFNPQLALEVGDAASRLLCPNDVLPLYRSPKTVVDVCLSSLPNATFVFYFLDYSTTTPTPSSSHASYMSLSTSSSSSRMSNSSNWVAPLFQYDVVVRPAGTPFFYTRTVSVDSPLADYHRKRPAISRVGAPQANGSGGRSGGSSGSTAQTAAESDGTEYLYANLRALYDALWEPVARISSTSSILHQSDCVVVVPHPSLLHVPFGALVSPKRKAVGQRACVVVSPALSHLAFHTAGREDDGLLSLPRRRGVFESWLVPDENVDSNDDDPASGAVLRDKFLFLNSETSALLSTGGGAAAASAVSSSATSASSFFAVPRQGQRSSGGGGSPFQELKNCIGSMHISVVHGGTRKELLAAFASNTARCIAVLSDSPPERGSSSSSSSSGSANGSSTLQSSQQQQSLQSSSGSTSGVTAGGVFRMADGDVHLSELTALRRSCSEQLELVVVTNDRRHQPTIFDLGSAARLCTAFNCKRVLRVDVVGGAGGQGKSSAQSSSSSSCITHQHVLMVQLFLYFVHIALSNGLRYPYAVALQAAQAEAIRQYSLPPHIWGGITLVGAP